MLTLVGCVTAPKPINSMVASKEIVASYTEIKYHWVGRDYVPYKVNHPFKRYITIIWFNDDMEWQTYSFYVSQDEYNKAISGEKYTGPIYDNYGMWPMQFK